MYIKGGISHFSIFLLGLILFLPQFLQAQEDSTRIVRDSLRFNPIGDEWQSASMEFAPLSLNAPVLPLSVQPDSSLQLSLERPLIPPYYMNPTPLLKGDYQTGGLIGYSRNAFLYASGGQTTLPGIGVLNDASLMYGLSLGERWELQGGIGITKMNVFPAIGTTFQTSAALMYHLSDRVTLKGFGSYAAGQRFGIPIGGYGGTIAVDVTDRFGLEGGVRRYYDPMRGGWQTVPVFIPSYRFDKFKLEMDVGGILYELLHRAVWTDYNRRNPTVAPPSNRLPVRPNR